jgi:serine/threonine-protein kinase
MVGPYRVERELGAGGMGAVFAATDTALDRRVALKVVAPQLADDERFRRRFLLESKLAARLEHPAIVPVYFAGETGGNLYLAMRYVDGDSLSELLDREGRLEPRPALALLRPIANALDAAHAAGLIHRDVKPGNILIEPGSVDGRPFLCDFGLARASASPESLSREDGLHVSGTMGYLAPEQLEGDEVTPATDQYALGCVLFECLAGRRPFQRDDDLAVIYAHLTEAPPSLAAIRAELGTRIDTVVSRVLAKQPGDRYPSCTAMVDAAAEALDASRPDRSSEPGRRASADRTFLAAVLTTAPAGDELEATARLRRFRNSVENAAAVYDGVVVEIREGRALAAFDSPDLAVQTARAIQHGDRDVGIALDTSDATVVRLVDRASGGEILTTEAVAHAATDAGGWHDLGLERIPGLGQALHLYVIADRVVQTPRARRPIVFAAVGAGLLAAAVIALVATQGGGGTTSQGTTGPTASTAAKNSPATMFGSVSRVDPEAGLAKTYGAGGTPNAVAVSGGSVWVLNSDDQTVDQIDESTGATKTRGGFGRVLALTASEDSAWLAGDDAGRPVLWQIDSSSGRQQEWPLPAGMGFARSLDAVDVGPSATWFATRDGAVAQLDIETGDVQRTTARIGAISLTVGGDAAWAVTPGRLVQLDPQTGVAENAISVDPGITMASLDSLDTLWALNPTDGTIWHITPGPVPKFRTISGGRYGRLAVEGDTVWVTDPVARAVMKIDPRDESTRSFGVQATPQSIGVGNGGVWVGGTGTGPAGATTVGTTATSCGNVETVGGTAPQVVIVSDFALQQPGGTGAELSDAVRWVLQDRTYKAGRFTVGYQACDSSTPTTAIDPVKCLVNARAFAAAGLVRGVIGTSSSECTSMELPALNAARLGPVAMVGAIDAADVLTATVEAGNPSSAQVVAALYPTGQRNYVRVIAKDADLASADMQAAQVLHARRAFIAFGSSVYAQSELPKFQLAAESAGISVADAAQWNASPSSQAAVAARAGAAHPDVVFVLDDLAGGDPGDTGTITQLRQTLGRAVPLIATDTLVPVPAALKHLGRAAMGMYVPYRGIPNSSLVQPGLDFVGAFGLESGGQVSSYGPAYAAQAAEILMNAIAGSDGSRASISKQLLKATVSDTNAIVSGFSVAPNGDIDPSNVSIFQIDGSRHSPIGPAFNGATFMTSVFVHR